MPPQSFPLVTLAIPLYHSRAFLEIILENLETVSYPNLEIFISDRHCADDTIDILETRYRSDARFSFFRARDEIDWVAHYNFLLGAAHGEYFLWMPHDDSYPSDYLTVLVEALVQAPDALVAYGAVRGVDGGGPLAESANVIPLSPARKWTTRCALDLFLRHQLWLAMRGVFRRAFLVQNALWLQPTRDNNSADLVWLYALACRGRFVATRETFCFKRFYPTSTHARAQPRNLASTWTEWIALVHLLVTTQHGLRARLRGAALALLWFCLRLGGQGLIMLKLPDAPARALRRVLSRVVLPSQRG